MIKWSTIRFSYNGLSLVDVSPFNQDLHHTEAYVMFDMLKQDSIGDELVMVPDTDAVDIRCGLIGAVPNMFASTCLTYKMLDKKLRCDGKLSTDEMVVYSFAVSAIKQACPNFNPDAPNEFMLSVLDTLNKE